jgi:predicted secreted protein
MFRWVQISMAVAALFFLAEAHGLETVQVNKTFNGREIKVRAGGLIRVELEELGSAGYSWSVQDLDGEHFEVLKVKAGEAPPPGDITGAAVVKTWLIATRKPGKATLKFLHYRPWEGEKSASETFILKVRIL